MLSREDLSFGQWEALVATAAATGVKAYQEKKAGAAHKEALRAEQQPIPSEGEAQRRAAEEAAAQQALLLQQQGESPILMIAIIGGAVLIVGVVAILLLKKKKKKK